jgi:predicted metal-binding membrane protein
MMTQANDKLDPKLGRSRSAVIAVLGASQTLAWASSYYLPAILADPIAQGTGVPRTWVFAAFSMSPLIAALVGPFVGGVISIARRRSRNCNSFAVEA